MSDLMGQYIVLKDLYTHLVPVNLVINAILTIGLYLIFVVSLKRHAFSLQNLHLYLFSQMLPQVGSV